MRYYHAVYRTLFQSPTCLWKKCTRKPCPVLVGKGPLHDFYKTHSYDILLPKEAAHMNLDNERLRKKYMDHPSEGMTSKDIRRMSEDNLLDMGYFLNVDDPFDDDDFGEEVFF